MTYDNIPLVLEDLKGMTEEQVKSHIASEYGGDSQGTGRNPTEEDEKKVAAALSGMSVLIAYESVGSWGCDSSSFFLLRDADGKLWENHGGHCSCYGFEGQWSPEETTKEALQKRGYFPTGGYDESGGENEKAVRKFVEALP